MVLLVFGLAWGRDARAQAPQFQFILMPVRTANSEAVPNDINDKGEAIGTDYSGFLTDHNTARAVRWNLNNTPSISTLMDGPSWGTSINNAGDYAGVSSGYFPGLPTIPFYDTNVIVRGGVPALFGYNPFSQASSVDLNDGGMATWSIVTGTGSPTYYQGPAGDNLGSPYGSFAGRARFHDLMREGPSNPSQDRFGYFGRRGLFINNAQDIVGTFADGIQLLLVETNAATRILYPLPGYFHRPTGLNNRGDVAVTMQLTESSPPLAYLYNYRTGRLTNLTDRFQASGLVSNFVTRGLNDSGEMVGSAYDSSGQKRAILYSGGLVYDLRVYVPAGANFIVREATAINNAGDIVGWGTSGGGGFSITPFLLRRANIPVGTALAAPAGARNPSNGNKVYRPPAVEALDNTSPGDLAAAYVWSDLEQKLHFFRPITVKVSWWTSTSLIDTSAFIPQIVRFSWPTEPQVHVANAPVQLDDASTGYRAVSVRYSEASLAAGYSYNAQSKTLVVPQPAYTAIHYVLAPAIAAGGLVSDPSPYSNLVQVIRTVNWNDPAHLQSGVPATVGTKVADPRGFSTAKSGFVLFTNAPYDGAGLDAAYLRTNQTGPIIPVNVPTSAESNLVVAFYQGNPVTGALWPDKPVQFNISWPAGADTLVIANTNGAVLPAGTSHRVYHQPVPGLPGYNPNEEHALLANGRLYALRNDLNRANTSSNFVLLKFQAAGEWTIKPYRVVLSDSSFGFRYSGEVGKELAVPFQMTLVNRAGCTFPPAGPVFADYLGKLYGRSGPTPEDPAAEAILNFGYQVPSTFFIDANNDRIADAPGTCTTWSGLETGSSTPTPVNVTYRIHWPATAPVLQVGESVLDAKHGLPDIKDWARADVVFDSLNPSNTMPLSAVARLYDPVTTRTLRLTNVAGVTAGYVLPPEVALEFNAAGQQVFSALPYHIKSRLIYNPSAKTLSFVGVYDPSGAGEPLLMPNVMTPQERDRVLQLSGQTQFQDIIRALYDLTRNPHRIDADRNGVPDQALLIGYTTNAGGAIVREQLGGGPKALTAAQSLPSANAFGNALQLDGSNYVEVPGDSALNAYPLTVTAWIRTSDSSATARGIVNKYLDASGNGYSVHLAGGRVRAWLFTGSGGSIFGSGGLDGGSVADGNWHHVAFTVDASGGKLYVDGLLKASLGWTGGAGAPTSTQPLRVGRFPNTGNFIGQIDEATVWNVARNAADIQSAMNSPLTGMEPGLVGYWRCDETGGATVNDGGNGFRDGAFVGAAVRVVSSLPPSAFVRALRLDGTGYVEVAHAAAHDTLPLTVSAWIRTTNATAAVRGVVTKYLDASGNGFSVHVSAGRVYAWFFASGTRFVSPGGLGLNGGWVADGNWHHVAFTVDNSGGRLFVDGTGRAVSGWTGAPGAPTTSEPLRFGRYPNIANFQGELDEVALWNSARSADQIRAAMAGPLTGSESGLLGYWRFDETTGTTVADGAAGRSGMLTNGVARVDATIPTAIVDVPRYLVLAENNASPLTPVTLHIVRVGNGPFRGDLKVIFPDNVFDERLTLRHSSDFGGDPTGLEFEWYYHPDDSPSVRTTLPLVDGNGTITDARGWQAIPLTVPANGANAVTIGDGGQSSLLLLSDNWFICRYRGYSLGGRTRWSEFAGGPGAGGEAQLAPGWVKRVVEGLNPFEQRTTNFHATAANTFASMLIQAGPRYEGNIALSADPANLNSVGLIESYTTVLNRARRLSVDAVPSVEYAPANNAMLLAASRISDLYLLLGNEAFADAADPTIGFDTGSTYGNAAPSIFAFQNQLDSLLEEELALLRGRDPGGAGVTAPPVYNRLFWNFTSGDGEVAYSQVYNLSDQPGTSAGINEADARVMYPQGHGDAWGHYLTAITTYYDLLRHPRYTWIPRAEATLVAGVPVTVDYLDERKFARAAAAKARTGAQLVDLTYRNSYVEDPAGQSQGYMDADADRAWGVSEWARRAGQGAFFDWVTANAILPANDAAHTGIQKIDRTTVAELDEIIGHHDEVQAQIDKADAGLNPLGLAAGAVPFDINPAQVNAATPLTHYEQVSQRALSAVNNTLAIFNYANQLGQNLRRNQDTQNQLASNTTDKERDLKNRMIEIFGYPYAGDLGAGGTYPVGYDGPDLYHYMYVNATELTGEPGVPQTSVVGFYSGLRINGGTPVDSVSAFPDDVPNPSVLQVSSGGSFQVTYPISSGEYALVAPAAWGSRRAPGKLQVNLSDLLRAEAKLKQSIVKYDLLNKQIQDTLDVLAAQYDLNADKIIIKSAELGTLEAMTVAANAFKATSIGVKRVAEIANLVEQAVSEGIPKSVGLATDAFAPVRGALKSGLLVGKQAILYAADAADLAEYTISGQKEVVKNSAALSLEVENQKYEVRQKVVALQQLIRTEVQQRYELYELKEALNAAVGNYQATLAQGLRLAEERIAFRRGIAATTQQARYNDMAFRIFQNDAIQKYRAQFDLAARYVYLAAKAYDYETCLLGSDTRGGQRFLTDIVRQRSLGQIIGGLPVSGSVGLTDPLARLDQNFAVLKGQLGFAAAAPQTNRFSLRTGHFRISNTNAAAWRAALADAYRPNLWNVPEFRKYCRSFDDNQNTPQPGIVLEFDSTITAGLNFFGWPLGAEPTYNPTRYTTKVRTAGVAFTDYTGAPGLTTTPYVYLIPVGNDVMRTPTGGTGDIRSFLVVDQKLPLPFPIDNAALLGPNWIPANDTLKAETSGDFGGIRLFSSFQAFDDRSGVSEFNTDTRLIGRSVWNTRWILIIPGIQLGGDPNTNLDTFINTVSDIKIFFQTYAYSGN